jgi:ABC-2 type transport system ATP-binding protein
LIDMPNASKQDPIILEHVSKQFGNFTAVNNISFWVRKGEIFGFLGPNGSGKTTTIRMALGLLHPSAGKIQVLGFDVTDHPGKIRQRIGYMSQRFSLYNDLTVIENLRFYGRAYGLRNQDLSKRIQYTIEMAGLVDREHTKTKELSGGWRQRLALGACILHHPEIIFLDEPTAGVDPISRRIFWDLLYNLAAEGITILVTTHYMDEAERCHRMAFIQHGEFIAMGTPAEIMDSMKIGKVLELSPSDPVSALRSLQALQIKGTLQVKEIALYGSLIHILAEDIHTQSTQINKALLSAGVDPGERRIISPSLEDLFIACMR